MAVQAAPEGVELRAVSERPTFVRFWGVAWGEAAMAAKVVVVVAAEQSAVSGWRWWRWAVSWGSS